MRIGSMSILVVNVLFSKCSVVNLSDYAVLYISKLFFIYLNTVSCIETTLCPYLFNLSNENYKVIKMAWKIDTILIKLINLLFAIRSYIV